MWPSEKLLMFMGLSLDMLTKTDATVTGSNSVHCVDASGGKKNSETLNRDLDTTQHKALCQIL